MWTSAQRAALSRFTRRRANKAAARSAGLSQADGDRLNDAAAEHYTNCCEAWSALLESVASRVLADLVVEIAPVADRFREHKRAAAALDFDDLIFAARDLLKDHEPVRRALSRRFAHVLVDEFQDTDPLQTEIFWRLCGEPPAGRTDAHWSAFKLRPGALFLVGDPKQAIYRFRGADVNAYIRARDAIRTRDAGDVLTISTNFRSCTSILAYVNERFATVLSSNGQPSFTALDPFHADHGEGPCVAALDVTVPPPEGKDQPSKDVQRDCEAEAVADMCARLIGTRLIFDRRTSKPRLCRPGDIALLTPTGTELWRFEAALEARGVPVSTQAGKGFFRRQEIQDLIAVTRALADRRDRLALAALLRGPLVGLSEEELLDIVWALPRSEEQPDALPRFELGIDTSHVAHPLARDMLERLQALAGRANVTTPFDLLSQAVDVLRIRPILVARHRGYAERALANVDLFLSLARPFAVCGVRAFAEAMNAAWEDEERAVEGRPDAQEEAVALYTKHAAKGLEWPIVLSINTMTSVNAGSSVIVDRQTGTLHCEVFGVEPTGFSEAREAEAAEREREHVRLWYVAATRAQELLVIPRLRGVAPARSAWSSLLDLSVDELPALDLTDVGEPCPSVPFHVAEGDRVGDALVADHVHEPVEQDGIIVVVHRRDHPGSGEVGARVLDQSGRAGMGADPLYEPDGMIEVSCSCRILAMPCHAERADVHESRRPVYETGK
jgi:ATP-dependent exoDNAse (exonuclease V) beta subunit